MLFFNRSAKSKYTDFSEVALDMHSHLIPGVDDGAKCIENSVEMISGLKDLGFNHLITTPHTLLDIHPNNKESLETGRMKLDGATPSDITLDLSSEYYLDELFQFQMEEGTLMPMKGNRILVEFSQISEPHDLEEKFFDISIKGYQIILAHPERYLFFHKQFDYYKRIKEMGVELQINALSLTDHYGKHIRKIAEKLIEKEMIDFIGTDIHHVRHLEVLKHVPKSKYFGRLIESGLLKNQSLF